jgi:uncharacterized protein (DUF849 family)
MSRKVIITCAVTGSAPVHPRYREQLRYPITPAQIAEDSVAAAKAGAAIVHLHARDPVTGNDSGDPKLFAEIVDRIRQSGTDVIINLTCGGGALFFPDPADESRGGPGTDVRNVNDRVRHIEQCLPDICSLDVTTANQVEDGRDFVYLNTVPTLREMARRFQALGVKPELETFQAGDVMLANQMVADGLISGVPYYQFVLGVKWGAPATPETVAYMKSLLPPGAMWTGMGISRMQMPLAAQSILLGGNVRVGLEDNLYLSKGTFATNAQLVERAVRLVEDIGEEVASPTDARQLLQLRGTSASTASSSR